MKPRHAAALALVGWYLMIPPVSDLPEIDSGSLSFFSLFHNVYDSKRMTLGQAMDLMSFGDEEPVFSGTWITMWSFDTLGACETQMGKAIHSFDDIKNKKLSELSPRLATHAMRFAAANCIATDDPRLKAN